MTTKGLLKSLAAVLAAALGLAATTGAMAQTKPLTLKVINSSPGSLDADFTLIMGEKDAVLVDTPFLRSDAYRLAGDILDSGKHLKTIIITHAHPDHMFGAAVLKEVFPDVDVIALPAVVDEAWPQYRARYAYWAPQIGANAPQEFVLPHAAPKDNVVMLEGHQIQLIGPVQGDDEASTIVWVPDLKAAATGDITFNQVHVYSAGIDAAHRAAWLRSLDQLAALNPEIVVAGHAKPGTRTDRSAIDYTRAYVTRIGTAIAEMKAPADYIAIMRHDFPNAIDFQGDFILNATAPDAMAQHNKLGK